MTLDKENQYVYRIGSDNQYRLHWDGRQWVYEFLAGGVLFDEQKAETEKELEQAIQSHGLTFDQFEVDESKDAAAYSQKIHDKMKELEKAGIQPCAKHGLLKKTLKDTCEACDDTDYFDDFKGTEG